MCDFRSPPLYVEDINTGQKLDFVFCGSFPAGQEGKVTQSGIYYVYATGSAYYLFDGKDWWCNRDDWGAPSLKYWLPDGVPPKFNRYRFIFGEDNKDRHVLCDFY